MVKVLSNSPYRNLIVGLDAKIPLKNGSLTTAINFDNAATTPPLNEVANEILNFLPMYSSIHRGTGYKSKVSNKIYEESRRTILNFVGGSYDEDVVIYVKNTSEAINKLSYRLYDFYSDGVILCSRMEHHSNMLPWMCKYNVDFIDIDQNGRIDMENLQELLQKYKGKVRLVAISGASNVTGFKNPIHKIAAIAHSYNAKILVDGAQLVPHSPINMKKSSDPEHIDYLVFSAHKMYAPFGIGVLIGPKAVFKYGDPDYVGGGTVKLVSEDFIIWNDPPDKDEAGSPNVIGAAALAKAINVLSKLGTSNIENYERGLLYYAVDKLKRIPDIKLYTCSSGLKDKVSIIPFDIDGIPHDITAEILSWEGGIAVRNGCFCAQPYIQRMFNFSKEEINWYAENLDAKRPGVVRLSFGMYNTIGEIDVLVKVLKKIVNNKKYFLNKYRGY